MSPTPQPPLLSEGEGEPPGFRGLHSSPAHGGNPLGAGGGEGC